MAANACLLRLYWTAAIQAPGPVGLLTPHERLSIPIAF